LWEEGIASQEKYLETSGIDDGVWVFIYLVLVPYSVCRIVSGYSFFLDCACTGQFTICVHRSLRKITHNSFTTDIGSRLRSTSIVWYVSRGPLFSLFLAFVFAEKDHPSCRCLFSFLQRTGFSLPRFSGKIMRYRYIKKP
jgi:hypothetical protein